MTWHYVSLTLSEDAELLAGPNTPLLIHNCCDLRDHIPPRSYALFQARLALQELGESLKADRRDR